MSRACLGKVIMFKAKTEENGRERPCSHLQRRWRRTENVYRAEETTCPEIPGLATGHTARILGGAAAMERALRENAFLSAVQVSLCLSRACLGKTIILSSKWRKRALVFRTVSKRQQSPALMFVMAAERPCAAKGSTSAEKARRSSSDQLPCTCPYEHHPIKLSDSVRVRSR